MDPLNVCYLVLVEIFQGNSTSPILRQLLATSKSQP